MADQAQVVQATTGAQPPAQVPAEWVPPSLIPEPITSEAPFQPYTPRYVKVFANAKGELRFDWNVALRPFDKKAVIGKKCAHVGFECIDILDLAKLSFEQLQQLSVV